MHLFPKSIKNTSWFALDRVVLVFVLVFVVDDVSMLTEFGNIVVVVDEDEDEDDEDEDEDDESRREGVWEKKNKFVVEQADIPVAWRASHTELYMNTLQITLLFITIITIIQNNNILSPDCNYRFVHMYTSITLKFI